MNKNRLFQMLFVLLEKGQTTAPELAEEFEVSVRTIYRDIDQLSAAGIPVYTTQGKGGGIFIDESFALKQSLLSEEEQNQLLLALQSMNILDESNTKAVLNKLSSAFKKQNVGWIEVDFSEWNPRTEESFNTLKSAIFQSKKVTFDYHSAKGSSMNRLVDPLKLVFKNREWYLYAYCRQREAERLFMLKRMRNLDVMKEKFHYTSTEKVLRKIKSKPENTIELTLRFDEELAHRVYENYDEVHQIMDGSYQVTSTFPNNESTYHFLLSLGEQVEVLAPIEVRESMKKRIKRMIGNYQT